MKTGLKSFLKTYSSDLLEERGDDLDNFMFCSVFFVKFFSFSLEWSLQPRAEACKSVRITPLDLWKRLGESRADHLRHHFIPRRFKGERDREREKEGEEERWRFR